MAINIISVNALLTHLVLPLGACAQRFLPIDRIGVEISDYWIYLRLVRLNSFKATGSKTYIKRNTGYLVSDVLHPESLEKLWDLGIGGYGDQLKSAPRFGTRGSDNLEDFEVIDHIWQGIQFHPVLPMFFFFLLVYASLNY